MLESKQEEIYLFGDCRIYIIRRIFGCMQLIASAHAESDHSGATCRYMQTNGHQQGRTSGSEWVSRDIPSGGHGSSATWRYPSAGGYEEITGTELKDWWLNTNIHTHTHYSFSHLLNSTRASADYGNKIIYSKYN